jgi:hypothetical protein
MPSTLTDSNFDEVIRQLAAQWAPIFRVPEKVTGVAEFANAPPLLSASGMRPIFRGEPSIFQRPLTPALLRENFSSEEDLRQFEIEQIMEAISEYSNSVIADRFLNAFSPLMHELDLNWLFFARHIEKKTRLLDVSRNPLVALYFACGKVFDSDGSELHKDGVVYFFQTSSYRPIKKTYVDPLDRRDFPTLPISYSEFLSPDFDPRVGGEVPYLIFQICLKNGYWHNRAVFTFGRTPMSAW